MAAVKFGGAIAVLSVVDVAGFGGTITELIHVVVAEFGSAITVLSHAVVVAVKFGGGIIECSCSSGQISLQCFHPFFCRSYHFLGYHLVSERAHM